MIARGIVAAVALGFAASGTAHAASLVSPPLTPGDGNGLACAVTNAGGSSQNVTIEVYGFVLSVGGGQLIAGPSTVPVAPLATHSLTVSDGPDETPRVCKFSVPSWTAKALRAVACVVPGLDDSNPIVCVPAQ
jgi:hypothetical protein